MIVHDKLWTIFENGFTIVCKSISCIFGVTFTYSHSIIRNNDSEYTIVTSIAANDKTQAMPSHTMTIPQQIGDLRRQLFFFKLKKVNAFRAYEIVEFLSLTRYSPEQMIPSCFKQI